MDHDARCPARLEPADSDPARLDPARLHPARLDAAGLGGAHEVDWLTAQAELDACDGYVVLAVDPQTGEVDAHGPFPGFGALQAAESLRSVLDREELADVVVRVVRWHREAPGRVA